MQTNYELRNVHSGLTLPKPRREFLKLNKVSSIVGLNSGIVFQLMLN
jgi:hypothetical protein